ncbi:MAG: hypothetical protein ACO4B5_12440 [Steroidobacteraceae bacterium]
MSVTPIDRASGVRLIPVTDLRRIRRSINALYGVLALVIGLQVVTIAHILLLRWG